MTANDKQSEPEKSGDAVDDFELGTPSEENTGDPSIGLCEACQ